MEFGIGINSPLNVIKATTLAEKRMLENKLLQTKLAYEKVDFLEIMHGEIYEGEKFSATRDGSKVTIPFLMADERRASYYLRMTLDANAVKNGYLPLHAAALTNNGLTQFIFAKTGKGKSFTLNTLLSHNSEIIPIGDDHVIIGNNKMSGNKIMRTRNRNGEDKDYSVLHNSKASPLGNYEIILMDVTTQNNDFEIGRVDLVRKEVAENAVLKYLSRKPPEIELEKMYNNIASKKVLGEYRARFDRFIGRAERVSKLSGERNYILDKLTK